MEYGSETPTIVLNFYNSSHVISILSSHQGQGFPCIHQVFHLLLLMKVYSLLQSYHVPMYLEMILLFSNYSIPNLFELYYLTSAPKSQLCRDGGVEGLRR